MCRGLKLRTHSQCRMHCNLGGGLQWEGGEISVSDPKEAEKILGSRSDSVWELSAKTKK